MVFVWTYDCYILVSLAYAHAKDPSLLLRYSFKLMSCALLPPWPSARSARRMGWLAAPSTEKLMFEAEPEKSRPFQSNRPT